VRLVGRGREPVEAIIGEACSVAVGVGQARQDVWSAPDSGAKADVAGRPSRARLGRAPLKLQTKKKPPEGDFSIQIAFFQAAINRGRDVGGNRKYLKLICGPPVHRWFSPTRQS